MYEDTTREISLLSGSHAPVRRTAATVRGVQKDMERMEEKARQKVLASVVNACGAICTSPRLAYESATERPPAYQKQPTVSARTQ